MERALLAAGTSAEALAACPILCIALESLPTLLFASKTYHSASMSVDLKMIMRLISQEAATVREILNPLPCSRLLARFNSLGR